MLQRHRLRFLRRRLGTFCCKVCLQHLQGMCSRRLCSFKQLNRQPVILHEGVVHLVQQPLEVAHLLLAQNCIYATWQGKNSVRVMQQARNEATDDKSARTDVARSALEFTKTSWTCELDVL